ncbi:hypothetical protein RHP75_15895 [Pseudomonas sp. SG20056]|uniref:hypothetical protein n=1 Tax=Pseudomonas sp. SG20056 TaxID=3074146 RepID=UPI00287F775C|nr:hypothetical protein [Pseudomonas sp. SG20056]WNF45848.1 hypothetical protein RHP75_15895 [Pseudomonas sp. SG20056]
MFDREFHIRFTLAQVAQVLLLSPLVLLPAWGLISLPWGGESAPAWVQAIGSVGAIAAALVIANHQHAVAERNSRADEQDRFLGFASRLAFFALELEQIMSNVVADKHQPGVDLADARVADVLQVMLGRLNQNFDDDPDMNRAGFCFQLRVLLAGCIFTLRSSKSLSPTQRDIPIAQYKADAKQMLDEITAHAKAVRQAR